VRQRSWLYVPGDQPRKIAKAAGGEADVVILDNEDAVPADRKAAGRECIAAALAGEDFGSSQRYVRINALASAEWCLDLEAILPGAPDGLVLPKASTVEAVTTVAAMLREAAPARLPRLVPILTEDVAGVFAMGAVMEADPLVESVHWGSEDLSASLGTRRVKDECGTLLDPFRLVRSLSLLEAVRRGKRAIDTPYLAIGDLEGLRREAQEVAWMGFAGKQAIHPEQVPVINELFQPDDDELRAAREIVAAFARDGAAVVRVDDTMLDSPHLLRARNVLRLAGEDAT
jgi:citrate lyase subunit beta / citryl-CoA lyase